MAWQLNLTLLAANAGLFAAANSMGLFRLYRPVDLPLLFLLATGALINVVGFFVLQRSKIHRESRLFGAYLEEERLAR